MKLIAMFIFLLVCILAVIQRKHGKLILLTVPLLIIGWTMMALAQQTYTLNNLTAQDILTIGAGLDKLPREDTDRGQLYQRLQSQITQQNQAAAKAQADAQKAAIDKAVADAARTKTGDPQP